ncbi:aspartate aminotransferase [Amycolatopsis marina]|uniref:Aminotransferase n=1 Tax=Amycolatopsis marina TaxID=490629 RepID=A0A1I1C104_9PSEU|nr:pyridoxal phosphate-dependent aminotransferase [Amycolatopsis marina]SFB55802.1 aspartate aminotransferase [Amycolatopsis marina]
MTNLGGSDAVSVPAQSATLAIDEAVRARRRAGHRTLHLGFGEAGLPVAPGLIDVLTAAAQRNSYGPVAGTEEAREAAAGWFTRRDLVTGGEQIIFAPGSKPLLFALLAALDGDVVLPRPAWVSYAAQAALLRRRVLPAPITDAAGGVPDPALLEQALRAATTDGARPGVLVLTIPDNPTGTVAPVEQVRQVCAIAERHGLSIICDEIYAELCHHGSATSAASFLPERTVVTSGLSKSLALGGWRIGYARTPDSEWGRRLRAKLTGIASELWSGLAAPMQAVATHVLGDPAEVVDHVAASARLHARVAAAVYAEFAAAGVRCRPPQAGFYLYPDFAPHAESLAARGITTSPALARTLLDRHGIAVLPGQAFGDSSSALTLRVATSLLYGVTAEERWAALDAAEPVALPWIAEALAYLGEQLRALVDGSVTVYNP